MIQIQSTDTFHKSCKKPVTGQKTGLRGRTGNLSFTRQIQADTFEGSRVPESIQAAKTPFKDKAKTGGLLAFGLAATVAGFALKR